MTQKEALDILKTGANVFLTGEPGSGKTHTINQYVAFLRQCRIEPAVTASTGIAATHIGGQTIHSWSGIGIKKNLSKSDINWIAGKPYIAKKIKKAKVLIIDEISMLDASTLEAVDAVCRVVKEKTNKVFGGMQVILVGDFFQLPPVAREDEMPPKFAFESKTWRELNPIVCYLSEQYRQEDGEYLSVLTAIRRALFTDAHLQVLRKRLGKHEEVGVSVPRLFSHNADVNKINTKRLAEISGEPAVFKMESIGKSVLVEALKRGCLSPERLELKKGALVMCTKNNKTEGFVNGTVGVVVGFQGETGNPVVENRQGRRIEVAPMAWTLEEGGQIKARITQVPLRLAWAITIHKSQGQSLDAAVVDLSSVFEFGQGYVALSRVRALSGLHLLGFNEKSFSVHDGILTNDIEFRKLSDAARENLSGKMGAELQTLHEQFVVSMGGKWAKIFSEEAPPARVSVSADWHGEKGDTYSFTLSLLEEARSLKHLAEIRAITLGTVVTHLETLLKSGRLSLTDINRLKPADESFTLAFPMICEAFSFLGKEKLKPIFDHLEGQFDYDTIRLARLFSASE